MAFRSVSRQFLNALGRAFRETGQACDRAGQRMAGDTTYLEKFSRHRQVMHLAEKRPVVASDVFVAPSATVVGEVRVKDRASVWYNAVVRGDQASVTIGPFSNIQDRAVVTVATATESGISPPTTVGAHVTVEPGAVLQSCTVEDGAVIGAGAVVMEGAVVEEGAVVMAGTVVPAGRRVPAGQVWQGNPAQFVRSVSDEEQEAQRKAAETVFTAASSHAEEFLPYGSAYLDVERFRAESSA